MTTNSALQRERDKAFRGRLLAQIGSLLLVALFVCGAVIGMLNRPSTTTFSEWSLLLTFAAFIAGERLNGLVSLYSERNREETLWQSAQDVRTLVVQGVRVTRLGSTIDGFQWLIRAIKSDGVHIRDTIFRVRKNISYHSKTLRTEYEEAVKTFIGAGNRYVAIGNAAGLEIANPLIEQNAASPNFVAMQLPLNYPVINFVIIQYGNTKPKEVLFGWDYDDFALGSVFLSAEPVIVDHFEELFSALVNHPEAKPAVYSETAA